MQAKLAHLRYRWRRMRLGRAFRHMAELHPQFKLSLPKDSCPAVYWQGRHVASLIPLKQLMAQYSAQPIFIIASGPSLAELDLSVLKNQATMGVNGSFLKFEQDGITPRYYAISDADFVANRWSIMHKIINSGSHYLFTPTVLSKICERDPAILRDKKITLIQTHFRHYGHAALEPKDVEQLAASDQELTTVDGRIGFSKNPEKGLFSAHTITYFAVQLAYGFGFSKVYLLGMDLGSPTGKTRFYESGTQAMLSHMDRDYLEYILPSFEVAMQAVAGDDFQIFNTSKVSRLPHHVVPKVDFDDIFELE